MFAWKLFATTFGSQLSSCLSWWRHLATVQYFMQLIAFRKSYVLIIKKLLRKMSWKIAIIQIQRISEEYHWLCVTCKQHSCKMAIYLFVENGIHEVSFAAKFSKNRFRQTTLDIFVENDLRGYWRDNTRENPSCDWRKVTTRKSQECQKRWTKFSQNQKI